MMRTLEQALLGGPGHDGYAFNADVYCVDCGRGIVQKAFSDFDGSRESEAFLDSDDTKDMPQPIFFGEADYKQHCAACGEYLYGGE